VNAVQGSPWRALRDLSHRADLRVLFTIDFLYWGSFAVYQTTFALFGARRFGFDATHTGYLLAAFGFLGSSSRSAWSDRSSSVSARSTR
jgi:nitrate/nitrite transporter NarK